MLVWWGCAHASIGGALISWAGAQKLTQSALPVERPVDTYVERLVRDGSLHAWASLPAVAHVDGRNTSDSVRRYLRVEGQHVHYTFRADDASLPTCFDTPWPDHGGRGVVQFLRLHPPATACRMGSAGAARASCRAPQFRRERMRATEHAPRGPFYLLERRHGLRRSSSVAASSKKSHHVNQPNPERDFTLPKRVAPRAPFCVATPWFL